MYDIYFGISFVIMQFDHLMLLWDSQAVPKLQFLPTN
jgi:hypothetical protein